MTEPEPGGASGSDGAETSGDVPRRSDRSAWNWLLLLPIVIPLITPLFNRDSPRLGGIPMFYWLQIAFIVLGVGATTIVYRVGKRRRS
ncbi:hypothetical protein Athai_36940 [Actinocatenispora thailandica]|uniref:DUF3311 domain-containing protein n=1 Tax=Actinocatenispora thailandica TaxID=227318 RepID=A0A7R7DR47_9ACTN|nr:DUF3311 domain-containing protein [Actinocatenispora thailandica]BCJ36191.1 hypothetical protein Athai_36940 [Actinocatenispora thailandica]